MRIAIISQQGGKASGAEHALFQFVSRLPRTVELMWFFFEDGEFAESVRRRFSSVTIVPMSERVASAKREGLPLNAVTDSISVTSRLVRELSAARPDLVLTNSMKAHIIGALAAKLAGLRCLSYIHDIVDGKARSLLRFVSRLCAVERLTCSGRVKANVALPATTVVYAAIDAAQFTDLPDRREARAALGLPTGDIPIVGIVGRIAPWKGQDRFIRIASLVLARRDAHFCIVGSPLFGCDQEYIDQLHADIKRLGLSGRVTFVPWQDEMRNVYAALDVACNCSDQEPFGRTSLEALASAVPIVCFDDAGICEIFEQHRGGTRVPVGDDRAFADAIVTYLADPLTLQAARADARSAAEQMDITRAYEVFIAALERTAKMTIRSDHTDGAADKPQDAVAGQDEGRLMNV